MPSEKLIRILKSKSLLPLDQIESITEADGWDWVYSHASPRKEKLPSICFTGFSQIDKTELSGLATSAHLRVVGAVSTSLSFLCVGENAGPSKLEKAKGYGVTIMTRTEFINFLETGEVPI